MNKQDAKKQFNDLTEKFNIEHTFSFDEAWDWVEYKKYHIPMKNPMSFFPARWSEKEFEDGVMKIQSVLQKNGHSKEVGAKKNPVIHKFTDGQYIREIFNPAGELIITAIHKVQHPFFLLMGEMSIITKDGESRIKAPHYGVTEVGTKRIIYAHTDCIFVTVHPNPSNERDLEKIESQFIAERFDETHSMKEGVG